ncbi:MAG: glycosyltransferase [Lachnospiraceae bacterium]|nr:glycosyltransferase [Lachnospiraceae bacterium]
MKIGFLVLHYNEYEVTRCCIESIINLENDANDEVVILIVDNASTNDSGKLIEAYYRDNKCIQVLLLSNTTGFSYGNNLGYQAIKNEKLDFLVVCNNDIEFHQKDTLCCIKEAFIRTGYYVMGPDIYIPIKRKHDNPHHREEWDEQFVNDRISKLKAKMKVPIGRSIIKELWWGSRINRWIAEKVPKKINGFSNIEYNVTLSGACLVFSTRFMACNEYLFFPETPFYWEEEILMHKCKINNWLVVYYPYLSVIHREGTATRKNMMGFIERRKEKAKVNIESAQIYLRYLKNKKAQ